MTTYEDIQALFEADMENAYTEPLNSRHNYNATYFRQMLDDYKAVGTALLLIDRDDIPYGLAKLCEIGMLHCSVEAIILKPEYRFPGFEPSTEKHRQKARQRLKYDCGGYVAPWDDGN